jgi:hypothetical protein
MAAAEREHPLLQFGAGTIRIELIADRETKEFRLSDGRVELGWGK